MAIDNCNERKFRRKAIQDGPRGKSLKDDTSTRNDEEAATDHKDANFNPSPNFSQATASEDIPLRHSKKNQPPRVNNAIDTAAIPQGPRIPRPKFPNRLNAKEISDIAPGIYFFDNIAGIGVIGNDCGGEYLNATRFFSTPDKSLFNLDEDNPMRDGEGEQGAETVKIDEGQAE